MTSAQYKQLILSASQWSLIPYKSLFFWWGLCFTNYVVVMEFWEKLFMNVPFPSPSRWWWCYYCCWLTFFISHSKDWLSGILPFWQFRQSHLLYRIPINLALADRTVLRIVTLSTRGFVDMSRRPTDTKKGDVRYGISWILNLKLSVLLLIASLALLTRGHRIDFKNCLVNDFVKD